MSIGFLLKHPVLGLSCLRLLKRRLSTTTWCVDPHHIHMCSPQLCWHVSPKKLRQWPIFSFLFTKGIPELKRKFFSQWEMSSNDSDFHSYYMSCPWVAYDSVALTPQAATYASSSPKMRRGDWLNSPSLQRMEAGPWRRITPLTKPW